VTANRTLDEGSPTRRTRSFPSRGRSVPPLSLVDLAGPEWELVLRIAASRRFRRSSLLTNFLLYITHQALTGSTANINEHEIGVQVFGRDEQFNRSDDNIVRNYARMLRARLDEYFRGEGSNEVLRVHIPRGGYLPVFTPVPQAEVPPEDERRTAEPFISTPEHNSAGEVFVRFTQLLKQGWLLALGLLVGLALVVAQPWNWTHALSTTARLNHLFWRSSVRNSGGDLERRCQLVPVAHSERADFVLLTDF